MNQRSSRKVPEAFVSDAVKTIGLVQFWCVYQPSDVMRLYFFRGIFVYSLEQGLHSSPRPPFMVFVTQVMRCDQVSQAISNRVVFFYRLILKA